MSRTAVLTVVLLTLVTGRAPDATEPFDLAIAGQTVPVSRYPADGQKLILWLPPERGMSPRMAPIAEELAAAGVEVWIPDLHSGYFLPESARSLAEVPKAVVPKMIAEALGRSGKTLYLMGSGRTAALLLEGVRDWQLSGAAGGRLGGAVLLYPKLYRSTPQGGEDGKLLPVAQASNLPIYLMQPSLSTGIWWVSRIVDALESGGSPVYLQRISGVSDGFHVGPDPTDMELDAARRLPARLVRVLALLDAVGGTPALAAPAVSPGTPTEPAEPDSLLRPYLSGAPTPTLDLRDIAGGRHRLAEQRGKVILVNFWASWCPPCVQEIPSLSRLYRRLHPQGLEIFAVDVGEPAEEVKRFLSDKPTGFPVLLDPDGVTVREWKVYAFPTTFAVDAAGRIRYSVFGAFDWETDEVVETLRRLIEESRGPTGGSAQAPPG